MKAEPITKYHKAGTIFAKGQMLEGKTHGHWKWYRRDGTMKRSGFFDKGKRVGKWITYDETGKPYKETSF